MEIASDEPAAPTVAPGGDDAPASAERPSRSLPARVAGWFRGHPLRLAALVAALVVAAVGGAYWVHRARTFEDTDDAQVDGNLSAVSSRITGTVTAVHVEENQSVHAGQLLVELDPRDYDVALAQAHAAVAQALAQLEAEDPNVAITESSNTANVATSRADVASAAAELATAEQQQGQARAQLAQAEANDRYAQAERARAQQLVAAGAIAQSEYDQRASAAAASSAQVRALRASLEAAGQRVEEQRARVAAAQARVTEVRANAPEQLAARRATVTVRQANLEAARAQLAQAELNRGYVRIVAPVDGIVGRKSVNVGDHVAPGQQLFSITQTGHLWVTANFRETQLRHMHPGQPASIHVDALALDLRGHVESMPGATGARYSLLPPENATGNYVKVVQRLPVRIRFDPGQPAVERLRPGMSVEPTVRVR